MPDINSQIVYWFRPVLIGVSSVFFLMLGFDTLRFSYTLKNPVEFLLCFFASNLIILISAVGCFYLFIAIRKRFQKDRMTEE